MLRSLVGSEMCIRDRYQRRVRGVGWSVEMAEAARLYEGCHRSFVHADANQNGELDQDELATLLQQLYRDCNLSRSQKKLKADIAELLDVYDSSGDGTLNFIEYMEMALFSPQFKLPIPEQVRLAAARIAASKALNDAALGRSCACLLYTSDAADEEDSVALGGSLRIQKAEGT
eukprot:TRINITY_DN21678_c0_g1_i2.p1 TRINITY_DN21678_c0_g1~~TRINITY_DN21678_c0_g1_i2.p1  ORF type:complete len:174 (+),score=63.58 TRINITY_DN21678_c0_g1_i2:136-657(+)